MKNNILENKLLEAGMDIKAQDFKKQTLLTSFYFSTAFMFIIFLFTKQFFILIYPILFFLMYFYFLKLPDVKIIKKKKEIEKEIIFATRFIMIELESGINLFKILENLTKHYPHIGSTFDEILVKVDMGTNLEEAINYSIQKTPSPNLRKILWQILNSIKTGSDLSKSLDNVTNQIIREQKIQVVEYGRKLNPLAMFYMMIAVIIPTIGITMFIVLASFMGLNIRLPQLLFVAFILAFIQFMFLSIIKSSRPAVEL